MKRVVVPELLDEDRGSAAEVQDSLADLRMLNRYFGGANTTTALLQRVARRVGSNRLSFLDVAGASGDVAEAARVSLARDGIALEATLLDRAPTHLPAGPGVAAVTGSAFQLPFRGEAFDVVGSSLFLHHLEPAEVTRFLAEAMRVARHAVIVNDLRRSRLHWLMTKAGGAIYRSALTRHDAPVSVKRAYAEGEIRQIIHGAGYQSTEFSHHFFYRMGIVVWKEGS